MNGVGKVLQEARRRRGLTLDEVERETRIRKRYLLALEQEEAEGLPPPVYALGFLKVYARFLDLDPGPLARQFAEATGLTVAPPPLRKQAIVQAPLPSSADRSTAASSMVLLMIVVAAVLLAGVRLKDPVMALLSGQASRPSQGTPVVASSRPENAPVQPESRPRPAASVGEAAGGGDANRPTTDNAPRLMITPPWFQTPPQPDPKAAPGAGVTTPAVLGQSAEAARAALERLGLRVATESWASGEAPPGTVLWQRPEPGAIVQRGELVQLAISRGPKVATVPAVVGKTQNDATKALREAGVVNPPVVRFQGPKDLSPAVLTSVCNGCVLSVSPSAGADIAPDSLVAIAVRRD